MGLTTVLISKLLRKLFFLISQGEKSRQWEIVLPSPESEK